MVWRLWRAGRSLVFRADRASLSESGFLRDRPAMFVGRLLVYGRRCRQVRFLFLSVVARVIDCAGCALGRPILCAAVLSIHAE